MNKNNNVMSCQSNYTLSRLVILCQYKQQHRHCQMLPLQLDSQHVNVVTEEEFILSKQVSMRGDGLPASPQAGCKGYLSSYSSLHIIEGTTRLNELRGKTCPIGFSQSSYRRRTLFHLLVYDQTNHLGSLCPRPLPTHGQLILKGLLTSRQAKDFSLPGLSHGDTDSGQGKDA